MLDRAASNNSMYLVYADGLIWKIDLNEQMPQQTPLVTLPLPPLGLTAAGAYLFAIYGRLSSKTHQTFSPTGERIDSAGLHNPSDEYVWSDANQKVYYISKGVTPRDLYAEEVNADGNTYPTEQPGGIGRNYSSPLHTDFGFRNPIRISPDGNFVALGSGQIHDGDTLARLTPLPTGFVDAAWIGSDIFTIRDSGSSTTIEHWVGPPYVMENTAQLAGRAHSLRAIGESQLLAITISDAGIPIFTVLDSGLAVGKLNLGDTDFDGTVGLDDLNNVRNYFGGAGYGDADGDGDMDLDDLNAVRNNFGTAAPQLIRRSQLAVPRYAPAAADNAQARLINRKRADEIFELSARVSLQDVMPTRKPQASPSQASDLVFDMIANASGDAARTAFDDLNSTIAKSKHRNLR